MLPSEITENYLKQVLLFKSKNDDKEYTDEKHRENLVDKLLSSLDFNGKLIQNRKIIADQSFRVFKLLKDDKALNNKAPVVHKQQVENYIIKALALDPFNENYLKEYLFDNWKTWKTSEEISIRLLKITHPNTSEFQDYLVDLKLGSEVITYDYLSEDITGPLIDGFVFLSEELDKKISQKKDKGDELRNIAINAGVDNETLKQINEELPDFINSAEKVFDNHWLDWTVSHKAVLSMEKALDLAPYNPRVLTAAIRFYGGFYWRLILGYAEVRNSLEAQKGFFKSTFGKEKVKAEEKWIAARESFLKAQELEERYFKFVSKDLEDAAIEGEYFKLSGAPKHLFMKIPGMRFEEDLPAFLKAYMVKESIAIQVLKSHFFMKSKSNLILLVSMISIAIIVGLLSYFFFIYVVFQAPLILGMVGGFGVIELRKKIWQRKPIEIINDISASEL